MSFKVCILAAGTGSRMGEFSQLTNKALLPLDDQAAITRIIQSFPDADEFVIAVGWQAEDVRGYVALAHPEVAVKFIDVEPFQGTGSGPGLSLWQCRSELQQPFYVVCADTVWTKNLPKSLTQSWIGVARVDPQESANYCMIKSKNGIIESIRDKTRVGSDYQAFIGLFFVHDPRFYFEGLNPSVEINGELQLSEGLALLCERSPVSALEFEDWVDIGTEAKYIKALESGKSRLRKRDEIFYSVPPRVIKFFKDHSIAEKRAARANLFPEIFPQIVGQRPGFFAYNYISGKNLYECNRAELFPLLLNWLDKHLWHLKPEFVGLDKLCQNFYEEKTKLRLATFLKRNPGLAKAALVNERKSPDLKSLIESVNWLELCEGVPSSIHGDLQFSNIIFNSENKNFHLIDWRQDFAGSLHVGDIYYDLAKLLSGVLIHLDELAVQSPHITQTTSPDGLIVINMEPVAVNECEKYLGQLKAFVEKRGLSFPRVQTLSGLIFLNMAALHPAPMDRFLYFFGRYVLANAE